MDTGWIAVDWGTTNLRVCVFATDGRELARAASDRGMGQLAPEAFEPALLDLVGDFLPEDQVVPVICCGMVGARQGWAEAPYLSTPCPPPGIDKAIKPVVKDPRLDVHILPGVSQDNPADVMRGEETQISGFLQGNPDFQGAICLPGTHTKWVEVRSGEIVSFRTFMTGELFALLSQQSVLRYSLSGEGWDEAGFDEACNDAMTAPQHLGAGLFALRAGSLLHGLTSATARARLSGSLIGLELAGARAYWQGRNVAIIGANRLAALYDRALSTMGVCATIADGGDMTRAGLTGAFAKMKDQI